MAGNFYEGTDAELLEGSANFAGLIATGFASFGLTSAQSTAYGTVNTAYAGAYNLAKEPPTRTSVTVAAKDAARKTLRANARLLGNIIKATPTVTNAQLLSLGLSVPVVPQPNPVPDSAPGLEILSVDAWTVSMRLRDTTSTAKRGKPPGVSGAAVFSFVGATAPLDISAWKFEGNTGRAKFDIVVPSTVAPGSKVWFTAFWFNGRKQSGPACAAVPTLIQGGGVSLAA